MEKNLPEIIQRLIKSISKNNIKPHRFALLLAISELYEEDPSRPNKFYLNEALERAFKKYYIELAPNSQSSSAMIEYPFYHLQNTGCWVLKLKEEKEKEFQDIINFKNERFTKQRLVELVSYASLSGDLDKILRDEQNRKKFNDSLKGAYVKMTKKSETSLSFLGEVTLDLICYSNTFVGYLNSLQQVGGSNENALAEAQTCNPDFAYLHIEHPLVQSVFEELLSDSGNHVILTGHAGDGKSTLAIDVLKRIKGMSLSEPLPKPLNPREDLEGYNVTIIKDLSERDKRDGKGFVQELFENSRRFLLVSNTGSLLDLFKEHCDVLDIGKADLESKILDAFSSETGKADFDLKGVRFKVFNLARMDNLFLARQIFEKMLDRNRWLVCDGRTCREKCPISMNIGLIHINKDRIVERIFLAYRRMYEYGTRLTLRQLTEHMAYMITSGVECEDIRHLIETKNRLLQIEHLFFNRFFGDNGYEPDPSAARMKSVKEIRKQGFGERPAPSWEHRLWLRTFGQAFEFDVGEYSAEFDQLRKYGARITGNIGMDITPAQAREQIRRMLYFLYDFKEAGFLGQYLNSPTLLDWANWQDTETISLGFNEKTTLEKKIYHVLQEHFTGVRLPEGSMQNDRRLYITLSRRRHEVRQSAQIVLAQIDWSTSTNLELIKQESADGQYRKDLVLSGKGAIEDLPLSVPFLDYVYLRHFGEIGEVLQASYVERLDRYKAQLQNSIGIKKNQKIMLVHLKTDHTFKRQQYGITKDRLEVSDVL